MDKTELYKEITEQIITEQQLHQSLDLLRQTKDALYKKDINIKETLEQMLPYYLGETIFSMADSKEISLADIVQVQQLIQELEQYLEKLSIAELVVAFMPTYGAIKQIADWWSKYTGKHVVLSIKIDETLISGAKVSFEGIYKDYSLATWIKQNPLADVDQLDTNNV